MASSAAAQSGDAARGEQLFKQQCMICHTIAADGGNKIGPNLHGVIGRKAGQAAGFSFSEAMAKSGIVWDDKTLTEYLESPAKRVPNGKMTFAGVKQKGQLDDMIAYLHKATQ
jgi:cytochrome c